MSEPRSALNGASYNGFASITEAAPHGMITIRGDMASEPFRDAVANSAQVPVPSKTMLRQAGDRTLAWMSPDELLLLCPYADVAGSIAALQAALSNSHHLISDVSDARAMFTVTGVDAYEVLAKLTPADISPDRFAPGVLRRTRLAQVPAAIWMQDETSFRVICFRSVAQYVFDLLRISAQPGSEVGYF